MPRFGPVKRDDLIRYLREFGFEGLFAGGKHLYMVKGERRLVIPNPHGGDVSRELLGKILRHAGIERKEWDEK